jgi:hypothetical protein
VVTWPRWARTGLPKSSLWASRTTRRSAYRFVQRRPRPPGLRRPGRDAENVRRLAADIKIPTLIGERDDEALSPANDELLHQEIRGSQLVVHSDAGNGFWFQDAGSSVAKIESFLS